MKKISQLLKTISRPVNKVQKKHVIIDIKQLPSSENPAVAKYNQFSTCYTDHATADAARKLWCQAQHF